VLESIRNGRTVAQDGRGVLFGSHEDVAAIERFLSSTTAPTVSTGERLVAFLALLALAGLVMLR
jgi:hypothetical protein